MLEVNFEAVKARKISTGEEIPIPAIKGEAGGALVFKNEIEITEENSTLQFTLLEVGKYRRARIIVVAPQNTDSTITTYNGYMAVVVDNQSVVNYGAITFANATDETSQVIDLYTSEYHPIYAEFTQQPLPYKIASHTPTVRSNGSRKLDSPYFTKLSTNKNAVTTTGRWVIGTKITVLAEDY